MQLAPHPALHGAWNGNCEGWGALFGRNSVLNWAVVSQKRHKRDLPRMLLPLAQRGVFVIRLGSRWELKRWLAENGIAGPD